MDILLKTENLHLLRHNDCLKIYRIVLMVLSFIFCGIAAEAQKSNPEPFQQCWEYNAEGISKARIASDNINQIFLSNLDGHLNSINLKDGTSQWKTELGGQTEKILYDRGVLYVVSLSAETEENTQKKTSPKKTVILRALSAETGIVKWQKSFESEDSSPNNEDSIITDSENVFLITSNGNLYKLSKNEGNILETLKLGAATTTGAGLVNQNIYVGTNKKLLNIYSITENNLKQIPLDEIPTALFAEDNQVIFGDKFGRLTALDVKGEKIWQTRAGAEITNITKTDRGAAVSSNDNFIYMVSLKNGGRLWKKRLTGRTTTVNSQEGDKLLIVNLNGDQSVLVETEKGKTINQLAIQNPSFFVNKPLLLGDFIIFHVNTGLVAYSTNTNCEKKKETN